MKKLLLLLFILVIGCSNPLDKVYEPSTFRTDFRAVQEYDSLSSIKIDFVIDYETPAPGATYQEILNRFPEIREELLIKESIMKEKLIAYKEEQEKLLKTRDSLNKVYVVRKSQQRVKFISILDKWGVKEGFKQIAIDEFDNYNGRIEVKDSYIQENELRIDIGSKTITTYMY
ncbi:MAG: hypothetical protein HOF44_03295 [Pelagibacterales bacterium]|nr:hypothetical protein [Pelagibacterales bacterium]MBT5772146.1 hypothetical protein [Flavobacteriaceae bacterium]